MGWELPPGQKPDSLDDAQWTPQLPLVPSADPDLDPSADPDLDPGVDPDLDPDADAVLNPSADPDLSPDDEPGSGDVNNSQNDLADDDGNWWDVNTDPDPWHVWEYEQYQQLMRELEEMQSGSPEAMRAQELLDALSDGTITEAERVELFKLVPQAFTPEETAALLEAYPELNVEEAYDRASIDTEDILPSEAALQELEAKAASHDIEAALELEALRPALQTEQNTGDEDPEIDTDEEESAPESNLQSVEEDDAELAFVEADPEALIETQYQHMNDEGADEGSGWIAADESELNDELSLEFWLEPDEDADDEMFFNLLDPEDLDGVIT